MASKTYIVIKDGEEIEKLKTLTAAKELADAEGAEVYCGEKCVYRGVVEDDVSRMAADDSSADTTASADDTNNGNTTASADGTDSTGTWASTDSANTSAEKGSAGEQRADAEKAIVTAEPVVAKKPGQIETEDVRIERYRLKKLMNIRKKPSLDAEIVGIKAAGTIVRTIGVEGDWLHLSDGSYVLYGGGEYAAKAEE